MPHPGKPHCTWTNLPRHLFVPPPTSLVHKQTQCDPEDRQSRCKIGMFLTCSRDLSPGAALPRRPRQPRREVSRTCACQSTAACCSVCKAVTHCRQFSHWGLAHNEISDAEPAASMRPRSNSTSMKLQDSAAAESQESHSGRTCGSADSQGQLPMRTRSHAKDRTSCRGQKQVS